MGSTVGQALNPQQPYMQNFSNAINQHAFNQQLGRGASNQMYQPPRSDYDVYTATRRPNYMPYGPNQQFYQPIYQPSYSQFSPMGYGQAPFGGFYQPPRMGFGQGSGQTQFGSMNFQGGDPGAFRNALIRQSERKGFGQPQRSLNDLGNFDMTGQSIFRNNPMDRHMMPPEMFGPATDISDQGQAALRQMPQPMLSPQPMQTQYRPIPIASQTSIDQLMSQARSEGAAEAAANQAAQYSGGAKAGGKVHEEGIDSLLKK